LSAIDPANQSHSKSKGLIVLAVTLDFTSF
jgi:hypothetical protein